MTVFDDCSAAHAGILDLTLQCVSNWIESETSRLQLLTEQSAESVGSGVSDEDFTNWMLLLTGSMVFFMQAGFAILCAGAVRKKNVEDTLMKNLLDAMGAAIAFYATGYAFAFGSKSQEPTFIGNANFFLQDFEDHAVFFFQYGFAAATTTIVAGTLEERCRQVGYVLYSLFFVGFVYPVIAHNIWGNGFLSTANNDSLVGMGAVDFAGSGVVHTAGGFAALFASVILGARQGRFYDSNGNPKKTPGLTKGHSPALQMLGTMLLWFCWYGFNPGSALLLTTENKGSIAAHAAVTTTLSGAAGGLATLLLHGIVRYMQTGEFVLDLAMAMNGVLAGLAAVTGGCGVFELWVSPVVGLVAAFVYYGSSKLLIKLKIDDAVDAIPVHLCNGIWGVLAVGLFASPELLLKCFGKNSHSGFIYAGTESSLLGAQLAAIAFVLSWTFCTLFPFFMILDYLKLFRVNELEEIVGLDVKYDEDELNKDDSNQSDEIRLKAYQQRFEELRQKRIKKSVDSVLDASWGHADIISDEGSNDEMPADMEQVQRIEM